MPRPKRKASSKRPSKLSASRVIVVIDNEPIRKQALKSYQSAEKSVLRAREEIEVFEAQDLPAYHRWEASVFGPLLTEIRTLEAQVAEKHEILAAIEDEAFWSSCGVVAAYRKVMKRMESPETMDEEDWDEGPDPFAGDEAQDSSDRMFGNTDLPPGFDFAEYDAMSQPERRNFHAAYAQMAAVFSAVTGSPAPDLDEVLRRERPGSRSDDAPRPQHHRLGPEPVATPEDNRLKSLYRQLVRQLHPDANPDQGSRERELWHEVQAAYLDRDLERLEAVAGRVEIGVQGRSHSLPLSRLARLTRELSSALRSLKMQIRRARGHVAWKFSSRASEHPELERERRRSLKKLKSRAVAELARLSETLDSLAARAAKTRPRRKSSGRRRPMDDLEQAVMF